MIRLNLERNSSVKIIPYPCIKYNDDYFIKPVVNTNEEGKWWLKNGKHLYKIFKEKHLFWFDKTFSGEWVRGFEEYINKQINNKIEVSFKEIEL